MNIIDLDIYTIITSSVLLLLSIITPMLNPFFRFRKKGNCVSTPDASSTPDTTLPPLSLVLTPCDDLGNLTKNLPLFLQQKYAPGYRVIVVIEQGDHDAESIIGQIEHQYRTERPDADASLYITRIPKTSRYISKKKLAITIGIKAATTEWVVLAETYSYPSSDNWLSTMASRCDDEHNLVIGHTKYDEQTSAFRRFERLLTSHYLMREYCKGVGYRCISENLIIRKSDFLNNDGFLNNLHLMRGEYDFLVNTHAQKRKSALVADNEAWLIEDEPTHKQWINKHLYYLESRKFLERSFSHRLLFNLDQKAFHLNYLLILSAIIVASIFKLWFILGAALLALLITIIFRTVLCNRALRDFEEDISPLKALLLEVGIFWHNVEYLLRYQWADKRDFTTHKL